MYIVHSIVNLELNLELNIILKNSSHQLFKLSLKNDTSIEIVCLKFYANHLKGVQLSTCSVIALLKYIHSSFYFRLKIV